MLSGLLSPRLNLFLFLYCLLVLLHLRFELLLAPFSDAVSYRELDDEYDIDEHQHAYEDECEYLDPFQLLFTKGIGYALGEHDACE